MQQPNAQHHKNVKKWIQNIINMTLCYSKAFKFMLKKDLEWLRKQEDTVECRHIISILEHQFEQLD